MSENSPTKVVWTSPRKVFQDLSPARNIVNNEIVFDKEELKNSSEFHTAENTPIKQCTIENIEYVHRRSFNKSSSESPKLNESKSDCSVYDSPKSVKAADQMDHIIRLFKKFNVHSPVNSKEGTSNNESTTQNRLFEQIDENSTANSNFYDALDVRELEQTSNQTIPTNNHFKDSLENLSIHIDPESNFDSLKSSISKENDTEFYESTSLETDSLNKNTLPSFEEVFKIPEKIHQVPTTFLNKYSDIETVNPSNIRASIQSVDSTFSLDSLNNENEENSKRTSRNFHEQLPELNFDNDLDNYLTPISSTELSPNPTKSNSNPSILSELINDRDMEEFLINERKIENIMLQNPEIISVQQNSKFVSKDNSPENLEQITQKIINESQSLSESIHETFDSKTNLIGIEQIEFENLQFEDRWENVNDQIDIEVNKTIDFDKNIEFVSIEKLNISDGNFIEMPIQNSTLIIADPIAIPFENDLILENSQNNIQQQSSSNSPVSIIKNTKPNEKVKQSNENGFEKDLEVSNASIETVQINIPNVSEKDIPNSTENTFVSCTDFAETVDVKNETIKNVSKNINSIENSFESCVETVENNINENEGINNETFQNNGQIKSTENTFLEDVNVSNSSLEMSTIIDKKDSSPNKIEFNQEKSTVKVQIENESIPQSEIQSNQQETLSTSIKDAVDPIDNKINMENIEMMVSPENVCNENIPNKTIVEENLSASFKDSLVLSEKIRPISNTDQDCSDGINISSESFKDNSGSLVDAEVIKKKSTEISEENSTTPADKTASRFEKENIEITKSVETVCTEGLNYTSNENLTMNMNAGTSMSSFSNNAEKTNEDTENAKLMEINETMELSSLTYRTPLSNETVTKEDIEMMNSTEIDSRENSNNKSNEISEENLTMEINKTLELNSEETSVIPVANEQIMKGCVVEIMKPTENVSNEDLSNASNEMAEENFTTVFNKTMELSSETSVTPCINENITKGSVGIVSTEGLIKTSNEMVEEILTTAINKTIELSSETSVTPLINEKIPTESVEILSNEGLTNTLNEMAEENVTSVFNKTMELSSETSVTPFTNEKITKESEEIVPIEGLIKTSNEKVEEILTTAINKTIELSSETSVTLLTNEKIPTESVEILSNEGLTNTLNEMAEENVTTVFNKTMELSSETSVTPFTNEKITKENIEIVSNEGLTNTLNEVSEENLTTVFNKTMELSSQTSVTPLTNEKIPTESVEILSNEGLTNASNEVSEEILSTVFNKTMEISSETSVTPFTNEKITKESVEIVSNEDLTKTSNEMTEEILNTVFNKTMELRSETSVTPCTNEKITKESEEIVPIVDLTTTLNEVEKKNLTTVLNKTMELSSETSVTPFTNEPTTKENVEIFSTEFLTKTSNEVAEEILTTIFNKTMDLSSETSAIPCTNEKITKESEEIDPIEGLTNTSNEVAKENLTTVLNKTMELSSETSVTPFANEKITKESVEVVSTEGVIKKSNEMVEEILTTAINKTMELSSETSVTPFTNKKITKESVEIVSNEDLTKTSNKVAEENLTTVFNKTMELSSETSVTSHTNEKIAKESIEMICNEGVNNTSNEISEENLTTTHKKSLEINSENLCLNEKSIPKNVEIMKPTEIASIEVLDRFCDVSETNLSTTPNKTLDINSMKNQLPINLKSEIQETLEFTINVNNDELIQSSKILMEKSLKEKDDKIAESTPLTPRVEHKSLNADMAATKSNEKSEINILNDIPKSGIIIEPELNKITSKVSDVDISKSSKSIENTKDGILESKIYSPAWNTELPISITENKTDNIIKFSMNWEAPTKPSNLLDDQKAHSDNLRVVNEDGLNVSSCSSELSKTLVDDETPKTASNPNTVRATVETNKLIDLEPLKQNTNQNQIDKLRTAADNIDSPQNFYSGHTSLKTTNTNPSQDSPSYCFDVFESSVTKLNLAEVHGNSVKKNKKTDLKIRTEDINVDTCLNILAPIKKNEDNFNNINDLSIINKKSIIEPILHEDSTNNKLSIESIPIDQIVTNLQSNGNNSRNVVDIQTKQHGSNIDELLSIRNQLESDQTHVQQSLTNTPPPPTASCSNTSSEEVFVSPRGFSWGALFGKSSNEGTFREPRPSTIKLFDPLLNNSPSPTSKMNINPNNDSSQLTNTNNSQTTNIEAILNENITEPSTCNVETQQAQIQEQHSPNVEDNFEKINIEKSTLIEPIFSSSPKTNQSTSLIKIESDEKRKELLELKRHLQLQNKLAETNQYQHLAKLTKQTQEIVLLIKYRYGHANDQLKNIIHETEERTHKKQKDLNKLEFQLQSELDKNKHLKEETIIARNHLTKCEDALNDVYEKYQAMRERIIRYEQSEKEMLKMIDDQVIKGDELNVNYLALKKQGIEDLTKLNGIYLKAKHDHETEFLALQGRIRRQQLLSESLESELKRKTEECQRLSEMCDEILIKKK